MIVIRFIYGKSFIDITACHKYHTGNPTLITFEFRCVYVVMCCLLISVIRLTIIPFD